MKPYRVEYVRLAGWTADNVGLWVAENDEWLLLRSIPVDYVVDGYVLLAKAHIVSRKPGKWRKQTELVLKLKGIAAEFPADFQFLRGLGMLRWVEQYYGLVEFADEEETTFLGWIREADSVHFWIDFLNVNGTVGAEDNDDAPFVIADVQFIRFNTDYFNSMKLLWQHKQRLNLRKPSDN